MRTLDRDRQVAAAAMRSANGDRKRAAEHLRCQADENGGHFPARAEGRDTMTRHIAAAALGVSLISGDHEAREWRFHE